MSIYQRLQALSIVLPAVAPPVAAFVPFVRSDRLVFLSGHIAKRDGAPWVGQLGAGVDVEQGKLAARAVAVDLIATLHAATGNLRRSRAHREALPRERHARFQAAARRRQRGVRLLVEVFASAARALAARSGRAGPLRIVCEIRLTAEMAA
jgi:hypothetical protein